MPQIQVIGREAVDAQNNMQQNALAQQQAVADIMNKGQMLRFYRDELKLKTKAQEDEVKKAKMQQDISNAELGVKAFEAAVKVAESQGPEAAQQTLLMFQKMFPQVMPSIMENGLGDMFSKFDMSGEEQMKRVAASALAGQFGGGQAGSGQGSGGYVLPSIKTSIGDFVNPEMESRIAAMKTGATEAAKQEQSGKVGQNLITHLEAQWNDAFKSNPRGLVNLTAPFQAISAATQASPKITNYIATRKATLSMLVRALGEKGTLSVQDVTRIERALPTMWDSKEVARMKFQTLRDIMSGIQGKAPSTMQAPGPAKVGRFTIEPIGE